MEARPIAELREKFFKKLETDGPPDSSNYKPLFLLFTIT